MMKNIGLYLLVLSSMFCINAHADVTAFGSNADNLAQGLQIGGGNKSYGSDGVLLNNDGHATWMRIQPSKNESSVEVVLYNTSGQGRATAVSGTSNITRISGSPFQPHWVGKKIYFGSAVYSVTAFNSSNSVTVSNVSGGVIPFPSSYTETFHVAYVSGQGASTVSSGGVVTRNSGDPFLPFIGISSYKFWLNGVQYTVSSFTNQSLQTVTPAPANGSYTYNFEVDINDQLSTIRIQKMLGADEENLSLFSRYDGYHIRSFYAGNGQLRPIYMGNSSFSNIVMYPDGSSTLGGIAGNEAIKILPATGATANRIEAKAAAAGLTPTLRARGSDANVGFGIDMQGAATHRITSHTFANIEFEVFGVGGTSWLAVQSDNYSAPIISANGAADDIDIRLAPKGNGVVWLGKYTAGVKASTGTILVKDINGNIREVLAR